jgi:hypothetical protein
MAKTMKNIYEKIADIQSNVGALTKDKTNPFFKSQYFDINQLIEQTQPFFEANNLVLIQPIKDNKVYSIIINTDNTEEQIESYLELPQLNDPQKLGSAITYYRRYTLQSLLGLQSEDDDGNKASQKPKAKAPAKVIAMSDAQITSSINKGTQQTVLDGIDAGKFSAKAGQIEMLKNTLLLKEKLS